MTFDWNLLVERLQAHRGKYHGMLPPCPDDRIRPVEEGLGEMPHVLRDMLRHFNGAELFESGLPLLTIFGISGVSSLSALEWAPDWHIDKFTPPWRASGPDRKDDWAIGMTNYGGLILMDATGAISEWDTGEKRWLLRNVPLETWIEEIMREGETLMRDMG